MNARSPGAFAASVALHAIFVAVLVFTAWAFRDQSVNTKIFELVAGEGDNYDALVAPAGGNPDSSDTQSAPINAPTEMQAVAAPPATQPKTATVPKVPDFEKRLERIADRNERARMKKLERDQKAREDAERKAADAAKKKADAERAKAETAVKSNRMSKEEFDRMFPSKGASTRPANTPVKTSKLDPKGIRGGVEGGSRENTKGGAGGTALERDPNADRLDAYFSMLIQRLKNAHERPGGLSDLLTAKAEFYITRDGDIFNVSIIRSSGHPEFDQSVLSAFRNVGSIGPRPDDAGTLRKEVTFKMRDD